MIREYERTSTAILNGYVHPRVSGYLTALEDRLKRRGMVVPALLTRSNGGADECGGGQARLREYALSGTASGVIGAAGSRDRPASRVSSRSTSAALPRISLSSSTARLNMAPVS